MAQEREIFLANICKKGTSFKVYKGYREVGAGRAKVGTRLHRENILKKKVTGLGE
jgi:hypothetical protein